MKTKIVGFALVLGLVALLGACEQGTTPGGETTPPAGESPVEPPAESPSPSPS